MQRTEYLLSCFSCSFRCHTLCFSCSCGERRCFFVFFAGIFPSSLQQHRTETNLSFSSLAATDHLFFLVSFAARW